jgi:uncharacterized protein YacL
MDTTPEEKRTPRDPPSEAAAEAAETAPASPRRRPRTWFSPRALPHSVADRITIWVARAVFFLMAVGLGLEGARAINTLAPGRGFTPLAGVGTACAGAVVLILVEALFARSPVRTIAGVTVGLLMGLLLSLVFQPLVVVITQAVVAPGIPEPKLDRLIAFLNLTTTSIFCFFGVSLVISTKDEFKFIIPYVEFRKEVKSHVPLILDTSSFIDGRLLGLLAAGVFDQRLQVARFVLDELQKVADSPDRSLRERGRRGLDILRDVERRHGLDVADFPLEPEESVDSGLLRMCLVHEGKLVTTDHNLTKRARVQGVAVININDIATAVKPSFVPGESLRVRLQRPGDDAGQAVGFLADGTMVVVEDARENIGQEVTIEVRSALQTSAGKMVFGRLARSGSARARYGGGTGAK